MLITHLPPSLRQCVLSYSPALSQIGRYITTQAPVTRHDAHFQPSSRPPTPPPPALLSLSPATLNSYTFSTPPNEAQLKYASRFFTSAPPKILFSAAHFRDSPPSPFPEVAFLGRSNVGKSSLLNALFGRTNIKDAHVSKRPGRTKTMNGFGVSGGLSLGKAGAAGDKEAAWRRFPIGGLVVVDMPGYGTGSREDWGKEIMKYLEKRKQLRRTFVLVDAAHGLKNSDVAILLHLRRQGISHQIILSKVDKLLHAGSKAPSPQRISNKLVQLQELCAKIRQKLDAEAGDRSTGGVGDILCCSAEKSLEGRGHRKLGVDEVRWAVLSACGMESDESGAKRRTKMDDIAVLEDDD